MRRPLISVVIPVRNGGALLGAAVTSCFAGNDGPLEVIVVDDGSRDGAPGSLDRRDGAVRILSAPAEGACAARNRGLDAARGELVKFLDADDVLRPGALDVQRRAFDDAEVDVVFGDFEMFGHLEDSRVGGLPQRRTGAVDNVTEALLEGWWSAPFTYLFRRETIADVRWAPELGCLQDLDFVHAVACRGGAFVHRDGLVGGYRVHTGQITQSSPVRYAEARLLVVERAWSRLDAARRRTTRARAALAHMLWSSARAFRQAGDPRAAIALARLERLDPGFRPRRGAPWAVRALTGVLGFERAERVLDARRAVVNTLSGARP